MWVACIGEVLAVIEVENRETKGTKLMARVNVDEDVWKFAITEGDEFERGDQVLITGDFRTYDKDRYWKKATIQLASREAVDVVNGVRPAQIDARARVAAAGAAGRGKGSAARAAQEDEEEGHV